MSKENIPLDNASLKTSDENQVKIYLKPDRLNTDPSSPNAALQWSHWRYTFDNFLSTYSNNLTEELKLRLLINHVSPNIFSYIIECNDYKSALSVLNQIYIKPSNEVFARHSLASRRQQPGETMDHYLLELKLLAKECNFRQVTAEQNKNDCIRDAFITGLTSQHIRQRLLENVTLSLDHAYNQALSLETAELNSRSYHSTQFSLNAVGPKDSENLITESQENTLASNFKSFNKKKCFFCGGRVHSRVNCPAANMNCRICTKKGHFANVCRSKNTLNTINDVSVSSPTSHSAGILAASPSSLQKATIQIVVNTTKADALIDTGSSVSFINSDLFRIMGLKKNPCRQAISLASLNHVSYVDGSCTATITLNKNIYKHVNLLIVNNLCADVILGHDILKDHSWVQMEFGGHREPLQICSVMEAIIPPVTLFSNLLSNIKPVSIKSRRYNDEDDSFIKAEISKLLKDGIIEPSNSPWRAQVLITKNDNHKKRMVIDYSLTINKYTELDAYPVPSIDHIINKVSKYTFFSAIDLRSAYHQIPILKTERLYTAFEACGNLYQFTRIPFGVTNGVSAFQRIINWVIDKENLQGTFAYLDDVTICGKTKEDHDKNLENFLKTATKYRLTINMEKSTISSTSINILGYTISNNIIKPDKERISPIMSLPLPIDSSSLKRVLGMFAHYAKWIPKFSEKVNPLVHSLTFPLSEAAATSFELIKSSIAKAAISAIDDDAIFTVETDASEHSLAATLSQEGRPVAFFSRSLTDPERRHSSVEKEAAAIVESLRKWRHYLIGKSFILITDQRSVAFMFNSKHSSKIKNEKIQRWRLELSCYKYDIIYRPGKENVVADTLSRVCATSSSSIEENLHSLHKSLCHPGITRMYHWVRTKSLPYSVEDIRKMTANCSICAEIKPRFYKNQSSLIKATKPFERLNIDFKGPLPSSTSNRYILTVIDEYSRFPFAFACADLTANTVINNLKTLFTMFGMPSYIHSDRGATFMSSELKDFLTQCGVASSRTTPYNPQGNGQVERLNGTLWKTIQLCLKSEHMDITQWEQVLPNALHSIRSLLCTSINATPHERMFLHTRKSANGQSLPSWLTSPGPVLLKKYVRATKYDPMVIEVDLVEANPDYSYVKLPDGREVTVSNRHLAPRGLIQSDNENISTEDQPEDLSDESLIDIQEQPAETRYPVSPQASSPRRSARARHPPVYLQDYQEG